MRVPVELLAISLETFSAEKSQAQLYLGEDVVKAQSSCSFSSMIALGDSYAAGLKSGQELPICPSLSAKSPSSIVPDCTSDDCARNEGAYGYQFAQKYVNGEFRYVACSGADTNELLQDQIAPLSNYHPDIATINIGGDNDNIFATVVEYCVYFNWVGKLCDQKLAAAQTTINGIETVLQSTFGAIAQKFVTPTTVYVMSYAKFWGNIASNEYCQSSSLKNPSTSQKYQMNSLVDQMNIALNRAATQASGLVKFVYTDVDSYFQGNRLCDNTKDPWFQYDPASLTEVDNGPQKPPFRDPINPDFQFHYGVFHPTGEGQEKAYLAALESQIGCTDSIRN